MLMQTDVKDVAESEPEGSSFFARTLKSGTVSFHHGSVESNSLNHWPVVAWASLSRLRTTVSGKFQRCIQGKE